MKNWRWLISIAAVSLVMAMACSSLPRLPLLNPATPTPAATPTPDAAARHLAVFEAIWIAVRDQYARPDYDGVDWNAVGDEYRAKVLTGLSEEGFAQAMRDMLAELPPGQAVFETRAERLEAEATDSSRYEGIGVFYGFRLTPQPHVVVLSLMPESPAESAGLEVHDSIYAVDGEPVRADEAETISQRIRGPADSEVILTVQKPGGQRRDVTVKRGQITVANSLLGLYAPSLGAAYYRFPVLADSTTAQTLAEHLGGLDPAELKGIVLDLRVAHSGGQGWPLGEMLTLFGDGAVGEFYERAESSPVEIVGQDINGSQTLPLVILIGPDTEGSPEIFAAALQAAGRAALVGLTTPGDVDQFAEIPLPDGSRLFLAVGSFRTVDGVDLALSGVSPDVTVPEDWDMLTDEEDPVVDAAVAWLKSQN
jgi:carboxyl-terminal processing protease